MRSNEVIDSRLLADVPIEELRVNIHLQLKEKWQSGNVGDVSGEDIKDFSSGQLQEFLDQLIMSDPLATDLVQKMDSVYEKISRSKNSEVRFRWIRIGLKVNHKLFPNYFTQTVTLKLTLTRI